MFRCPSIPAAFQVRFIYNFLPRFMPPLCPRQWHTKCTSGVLPLALVPLLYAYCVYAPFCVGLLPFSQHFFNSAWVARVSPALKSFGCNRNRITAAVKRCKWQLTKPNAPTQTGVTSPRRLGKHSHSQHRLMVLALALDPSAYRIGSEKPGVALRKLLNI